MENNTDSSKVVVITNGNYFSRLVLDRLLGRRDGRVAGVLVVTGDYKKRTGFACLLALARCTAPPYLLYKIGTYAFFKLAAMFHRLAILNVERLAAQAGVPTKRVVAVNSEAARSWVEGLAPDLLLSVSCPKRSVAG